MKLGIAVIALAAAMFLFSFRSYEQAVGATAALEVGKDVIIPDAIELVGGATQPSTINDTIIRIRKPLKLSELQISNRQVRIFDEINSETAAPVVRQLLELGVSSFPITVVINSPGGSVFAGADIISAMEAAKGPVNTLCVGLCASMGAMIHSYGTNRYMTNRSILMYHPAAGGLQGTLPQMHNRLSLIESFIGKMEAHVARKAKISLQKYTQLAASELWLDAEDATIQGFNDRVVFVRGPQGSDLFPNSEGTGLKINRTLKTWVNF